MADGHVDGHNLICGVHGWDYRVDSGVSEYNNKEVLHKFSTKIEGDDLLVDEFEIDADDISLDAHLYQDLDLDSIDAVDLVVKLREITGKKIDPDAFKQVRTVGDIVEEVKKLIAE